MSYTGERLVYGELKQSNRELPEINKELLDDNFIYFGDTLPLHDSIITLNELYGSDSVHHSFKNRTLVISSNHSITLDAIKLSGNIRILSSGSIFVTSNADLENVILYAQSIYFDKGFSGCLQAFAQDSLIAEENCTFGYPSVLSILNQNINGVYLQLKRNSSLKGIVFLYQENKAVNEPYLKIEEGTEIHGEVYCPGQIEIRGNVEGSVSCHTFMLNTVSGSFENHLLNVSIDRTALSEHYSGACFDRKNVSKNIQWLN
jgi:hypothetical protein